MENKHRASTSLVWDKHFIQKNNIAGPRYTSYPTAMQFHEEFTVADYKKAVTRSNQQKRPLSLYFHIPFCNTICYYCACNKIVTADKKRVRHYLDQLIHEIEMQGSLFEKNRPVVQLHWGGGTPTFFSHSEMTELMYHTGRNFNLLDHDQGEHSIEIDPRDANLDTLSLIHGLGFNRISLGVQDFDEKVQKAVNRVQPFSMVEKVVLGSRNLGFQSINMDLIYGLPFQTPQTYRNTIEQVIQLQPDRISLFNYAHLPHRFKTQRQIKDETLPTANEKLEILCDSANTLINAGYLYIGMDHFAKQDDSLAIAQQQEQLQRNFQGYSTAREADLIGMGVSAISHIDNTYSQNFKSAKQYEESLLGNQLPVERGYTLNSDDLIRQNVINQLTCHNHIDIPQTEKHYGIDFPSYFATELSQLASFEKEGLLHLSPENILLTEFGRLIVRRICLIFDIYNNNAQTSKSNYSRII